VSSARVVVLASGEGTNLQALLDRFHVDPESGVRVVQVISDRVGIGALARAKAAGVPAVVLSASPEGDASLPTVVASGTLPAVLGEARPDLIVLAGYLRRVPSEVVHAFRGRIINLHPALLPAFGGQGMYGHRVHAAVLESGVRVSGATVHFVDEAYDRGAIIAQWPVPVLWRDDEASLAARIAVVEHQLLPRVVASLVRGHVRLSEEGRCIWERPWFAGDTFEVCRSDDERRPAQVSGESD